MDAPEHVKTEALESSVAPIFLSTPDHHVLWANEAFLESLGFPRLEDALGTSVLEWVHLDRGDVTDSLEREGSWQGDVEGLRLDGERFEAEMRITLVRDEEGKPECHITSFFDITAHRSARRALEKQQRQMNRVLAHIDEVVFREDLSPGPNPRQPRWYSGRIFELLGVSPEELLERPYLRWELILPEDRHRVKEILEELQESGRKITFSYRARHLETGRRLWLEETLVPETDDRERVTGVFGTLRNISQRKASEQVQEQLQRKIRTAATEWQETFDALDPAVLVLRHTGRIQRLNRSARELLGRPFQELLRFTLADLEGAPWPQARELVETVQTDGEGRARQVDDPDSERSWVVSASISQHTNHLAQRWVVLVVDEITDLVRLQESLRRSKSLSAMGAVVAGVAHEVRNPLFGISATADALQEIRNEDEEIQPFLDTLQGEVRRLAHLMEELLEFGKPSSEARRPVVLDELVERAVETCRLVEGEVAVHGRVEGESPTVVAEERRLLQVLINLLDNAVQHSPGGGEVTLVARAVAGGAEGGRVEIRVEDEGQGFREEDIPCLTDPFFSRRPGGTGLGLSIVQRIVEDHHGRLEMGNRPEGGARVKVILPMQERRAS